MAPFYGAGVVPNMTGLSSWRQAGVGIAWVK
jgi:hypothetical protein